VGVAVRRGDVVVLGVASRERLIVPSSENVSVTECRRRVTDTTTEKVRLGEGRREAVAVVRPDSVWVGDGTKVLDVVTLDSDKDDGTEAVRDADSVSVKLSVASRVTVAVRGQESVSDAETECTGKLNERVLDIVASEDMVAVFLSSESVALPLLVIVSGHSYVTD
jgi:hypothetical protein